MSGGSTGSSHHSGGSVPDFEVALAGVPFLSAEWKSQQESIDKPLVELREKAPPSWLSQVCLFRGLPEFARCFLFFLSFFLSSSSPCFFFFFFFFFFFVIGGFIHSSYILRVSSGVWQSPVRRDDVLVGSHCAALGAHGRPVCVGLAHLSSGKVPQLCPHD